MKKIIITAIISLAVFTSHAQNSEASKGPNISTEDPHNPMVNGIPYSQYKVQVQTEQAEKKETSKKQVALMAPFKNQMIKRIALAKANRGKSTALDVYNKKHKEQFIKQKAELKAQKGAKTAAVH